jgi:hypothetical protein
MTEHEFIFWLRGYVGSSNALNKTQLKLIKHRLYYLTDADHKPLDTPVQEQGSEKKPLDEAIWGLEEEYEEEIELYKTYGGD